MPNETRTRQVFNSPVRSPLGCVDSAGFVENSRWDQDGLRTIYYYTLTYVISGRCRYTDPTGRDFMFQSGDLFICFPGLPHRFDPAPKFDEFWIAFGGPVFDLWRDAKMLDPQRFSLRLEPVEFWLNRLESLFVNVRTDAFGQTMLISSLQALLAEMISIQPIPAHDEGDEGWIAKAKTLIDSVERVDELDLEEVSTKMGTSYSNFRRKFQVLAGVPPRRYHTARVMQQACEWVFASNRTVREVADMFGFCDEFFFSRRFKQILGMSPREFRTALRSDPARLYRYTAADVTSLPQSLSGAHLNGFHDEDWDS